MAYNHTFDDENVFVYPVHMEPIHNADHNPTPNHESQSDSNIVQQAIAAAKQAASLKEAAILKLLAMREQIENDLKTLGYEQGNGNGNGNSITSRVGRTADAIRPLGPKRFLESDLAEVARILLGEHNGEVLHGSEIEKLAKAGGYESTSQHFQSYLAIALQRAGGFENIGGNRWRLNDQIKPKPTRRPVRK